MTPVRVNSAALLKRRWHDHYRFDDADLADLLLRRWHEREGLRMLELAGGRLIAFKEDLVVERVAGVFVELLGRAMGTTWTVSADRRLVHLDRFNVMAPCVAVHTPDDRRLLNVKHAALFVDFVAGANEERIRWGRRKYLRAGLRTHWLVDLRGGFLETSGPYLDVFYRYEADQEVPIVVDDVLYGTFKLRDVFTTG